MKTILLSITVTLISAACANQDTGNPNFVDSDVAGRKLDRVQLNRCKPSTDKGPFIRNARFPKYPANEYSSSGEGAVSIRFTVMADGSTSDIQILKSTSESFGIQAQKAIQSWKFVPAITAGENVAVVCTQRHVFELQ